MSATETGLADTRLLTADDLLRLSAQGVRGELVRGVLHETMASGHRHGKIAVNLATELNIFAKARRIGTVVASDSGVWLERDPDTVREPDVAFTSAEKIPLDAEIDGYAEVVPDLVVEIVSPHDSRRWARDRAQMWLDHGAPLVWMVHPNTRTIDVYCPGTDATTLHEDDSLDGHEVLPGFTCSVSTIFA